MYEVSWAGRSSAAVGPELVEGYTYHVVVDTMNANGASGYFMIRDGQLVEKDFRGNEISR